MRSPNAVNNALCTFLLTACLGPLFKTSEFDAAGVVDDMRNDMRDCCDRLSRFVTRKALVGCNCKEDSIITNMMIGKAKYTMETWMDERRDKKGLEL